MKKLFQIGLVGLTICVLAGLMAYIFIYNKPHKDVHHMETDYSLSVETLIEDFKTDEQSANQKYLDKVIQVIGQIRKIDTTDGQGVITLGSKNMMAGVICKVDPADNKKILRLKKDQTVTVKGICTGYLLDVMLVRAVIEK